MAISGPAQEGSAGPAWWRPRLIGRLPLLFGQPAGSILRSWCLSMTGWSSRSRAAWRGAVDLGIAYTALPGGGVGVIFPGDHLPAFGKTPGRHPAVRLMV